MHSAWYFLSGAILFEVAGTTCMKLSRGFTEITPSIMMFVFYGCAFALNTVAVKTGILYFKEPATALKMASLTLIIIGVMGLHSASVAK